MHFCYRTGNGELALLVQEAKDREFPDASTVYLWAAWNFSWSLVNLSGWMSLGTACYCCVKDLLKHEAREVRPYDRGHGMGVYLCISQYQVEKALRDFFPPDFGSARAKIGL